MTPTGRVLIVGEGTIGRALHQSAANSTDAEWVLVPARRLNEHGDEIRRFADGENLQIVFAHGAPVHGLQLFGRYASGRTYDALLASRTAPIDLMAEILGHRLQECRAMLISSTVIDARPGKSRTLAEMQARFEHAFSAAFGPSAGPIVRVGTILGEGAQFPRFVAGLSRTRLIKHVRVRGDFSIRTCRLEALVAIVRQTLSRPSASVAYAVEQTIGFNRCLDEQLGTRVNVLLPRGWVLSLFGLIGVPGEFFTCDLQPAPQP